MTFDDIDASVRILRRHDDRALVDFTPEGGTFSVIFVNPRMEDAEVADILDELLKMSFIDLSRTEITDAGALLLTGAKTLRVVGLPRGIAVETVRTLMQVPTVRSVHVAVASPPAGYEAVAGWEGCWHSTEFQVHTNPRRKGRDPEAKPDAAPDPAGT
jgi:hypothetical protein